VLWEICLTSFGLTLSANKNCGEGATQRPVAAQINRQKWKWAGHNVGESSSVLKKGALIWKLQGKNR